MFHASRFTFQDEVSCFMFHASRFTFHVSCFMFYENMVSLPSIPKVVEKKGHWAMFEIEALYPGYGITLGNALRRVLLSSLEGAAITKVKIKGVQHEFSVIPGVMEDVINVLLNLKQLRFKLFSLEPQTAALSVKGEKKVKGSDFKLPTQVELVNGDSLICSLTSKSAEIAMEITIEKGMGYEPVEARKKEKLEVGELPLDAIYTPVRKVSFGVENMRVGERTDYDRLKLEIETDGTMSPEQALAKSSEVLISHFDLIQKTFTKKEEEPKREEAPKVKKVKKRKQASSKKDEKKKKRKKTA